MAKFSSQYLVEALHLLRANKDYVFIITLIFSAPTIFYHFVTESFISFFPFFIFPITVLIILPVIYGQFIEIINKGKRDAWISILNNYWSKIVLTILIIKAPVLIFALLASKHYIIKLILSTIVDIISIYILPLVLLRKKIFSSIKLGLKSLFGNFKFSLPIVSVLLFLMLFDLLWALVLNRASSQLILFTSSIVLIFISVIIHFTVFITAGLILKDKLLSE